MDDGLDVVLQPGNYHLSGSIKVNRDNAVILGIGIPVLISENGEPCIIVGDYDGVRVAGILFQSGVVKTETLLQWGEDGTSFKGNFSNPGVASDIFARAGGPNDVNVEETRAESMMVVNSGYVVIDNTWLWRADYDINGNVEKSKNPVN